MIQLAAHLGHQKVWVCPDNTHNSETHQFIGPDNCWYRSLQRYHETSVEWPQVGRKIDFEVVPLPLPPSRAESCSARPCPGTGATAALQGQ